MDWQIDPLVVDRLLYLLFKKNSLKLMARLYMFMIAKMSLTAQKVLFLCLILLFLIL